MRTKLFNIFVTVCIIIAIIGFFSSALREPFRSLVITDIDTRKFADTIDRISYFKDDVGIGTKTFFKGLDTPFCFTGNLRNHLNIIYLDFAKKGDVIFKEPFANTFLIKRADTAFVFNLYRCTAYGKRKESIH